jgi:hypothetical protein
MRSAAYKKQGAFDWRPLFSYLMLFICTTSHTKSKGLLIDVPYSTILCFLHAQHRILKVRGLPIDILYSAILCFLHAQCCIQKIRGFQLTSLIQLSYVFYMHNAANKKQGIPDWHPLCNYLMLFTYAMPHTKSNGLPIDVPYPAILSFLHAQRRIQKQWAPNWHPLFSYLILFTCATPHIKSKGLSIDVPYPAILYFLHAQRHIQKAMGSRLTSLIQLYYAFYMRSVAYKK